ncbi:MAG: phage tail length tape measure family protein, partial [Spirochaetales bacterium]|nr:phage tail length tape measure family protein [Spirochaetales bacterium]
MAIRIEVTGVDNFSGTGRKVAGAVGKLKSKTEAAGAAMEMTWKDVALAVGALYIAFNKAKQIFDDLVNKYEKQILAETKLQSALVATGHAAGFTELQLKKMAAGMAEFTTYTDEALIEAEGLLLTFTQIGKDIFPQALEAAADMSAMFGQELKQSVIQLGTALNDPIQGIGRLRRIGISFTQEQKEMIKGFVELGDVMSAQQVIIDEINREFGGVARLMGETAVGAFRRLENKWVDLQEKAGQALLEGITPLFEVIEDFIAFLEKNIDVFTQVGQAIAFVGAVIINIIKFVIQFKEAIITFITIVWGLPAVLGAVSTAFGILNTVILANPFALVAAAIVGVIAAIAGMVGETIKANEELKKLKAEANELAEGELRKAARGLVKDMGELQTALAKARDEITKLEEAAINAGRKELDSLLDLISTYIDLQRKIEAQIKIRKEIELLERAQRDEINNLNEINQALDIAERKWMENARVLAEMIQYMREGEGLSDEVIIADESVKKLQQNIKYWQELIDQIKNTEKEIETYGAEWKKVVEQRIKMEEDFAQKYFQLVSDRITILEYERSEAVKKAQEIGAGTYNILRFYNEQIRREKEKEAQKRTEFEQEYSNKLFQLTADRVEILEWERQQATSKAAEMGAGIASVNAYYDEMVRRAKEELAQAEIETEQEKLLKLKQEQEAYARERMALEKEVHEYILSLADQALLSESRRLENQKQQEITRIEEVAEKWRRSIGYMVSAAGDIVIPFEKIEFSELLDGTDEVIDRTGEWNALYEQAYENERKINSAITSILLKYHELIEAAEREEELLRMIGEAHLDDFKLLEKITEEMKTQEQIRREQIESQIKGLEGLIRSVRTNLDLLQPGAIIEKLEYERIIRQANDAIVYLKTELAKIPTQVDIAFLELSEKVGSILEKYKDPLKKKKEALELEAKMVAEYVLALRKRYEEQTAYLRTLDKTSEEFLKGYAELYNLA